MRDRLVSIPQAGFMYLKADKFIVNNIVYESFNPASGFHVFESLSAALEPTAATFCFNPASGFHVFESCGGLPPATMRR